MLWLINLAALFENLTIHFITALIMPFILNLFKKIHTGFLGLPPLFIL